MNGQSRGTRERSPSGPVQGCLSWPARTKRREGRRAGGGGCERPEGIPEKIEALIDHSTTIGRAEKALRLYSIARLTEEWAPSIARSPKT